MLSLHFVSWCVKHIAASQLLVWLHLHQCTAQLFCQLSANFSLLTSLHLHVAYFPQLAC